jgi:hypothetical protein
MTTTRILSTALFGTAFLAISVPQSWAACLKPPASDQAISQFRANPQGLVAANSDTRTIEATTRDLAGTDASLAADLIRVAEGTNPRFRTAIAAGLAQAAIACSTIDQQAAQLIQQAVAGFQDGQFQASFTAVAGDLSTAATDAEARRWRGCFGACPDFSSRRQHPQWSINDHGRSGKPDTLNSFSDKPTSNSFSGTPTSAEIGRG